MANRAHLSPLSTRRKILTFISTQGRQIARPFFTKERVSDFQIFEQVSAKTLNLVANRAAAFAPIDFQDLLQRFTLDAAALFLWGTALNTLDQPLTQPGRVVLGPKGSAPADGGSEWDVFTNAFETLAVLITRRGVQGDTWPLLELFGDKTEGPIQVIMDWLEPLVKEAINRKAKRREANGGAAAKVSARDEDTVFLDYLADRTDGNIVFITWLAGCCFVDKFFTDVEHIRYELITFLIASRETVSARVFFWFNVQSSLSITHTHTPDILPLDVCDIPSFDESRHVSSSKGRSHRNFRSHRHALL